MSETRTVHVPLGERAYDILIGPRLLEEAGKHVAAIAPSARVLIISDERVAAAHLARLEAGLTASAIDHTALVLPPGEGTKSWDGIRQATEAILEAKLERGDLVIALGGGVIGDLAGFAAAIARRGMAFVQAPTSLLAQVDSSVGGKTGINTHHGKNLVGAFHQPALVLADTSTLHTLPDRELRAGYAEIVKYGLIDDAPFFEWLEVNAAALIAGDEAIRAQAIAHSCEAKARVVAADEREGGRRALLNLGHTFGHAIEALNGYDPDKLVHGEGVSIGMVLAHRFSHHLGHCPGQDVERVVRHLDGLGMPTHIGAVPGFTPTVEALIEAMKQDKKVSRGTLTFILTQGIGRSFIAKDVSEAALHDFLSQTLASA
ncbi:MAG: 3-dehydroquinate synthase [Devosiaceae bacterium]|nr:3-dehydroquinate synthase [Devosiaceae bacterium MH13]